MIDNLYAQEVTRHLLALRETLVRHDENIKAHTLLSECVPYFLQADEAILGALEDQIAMTAHVRNPDAYVSYYANNPHELPFEEMFGGSVADCIEQNQLIRVSWLIQQLKEIEAANVLDVACNDGAIAKYIENEAGVTVFGLDLNPTCVAGAQKRGISARVGQIEDVSEPYDAVYAMEVIEHVPSPVDFLRSLASRAPHVYISTPLGAVESGNVPGWATVEYKGHVRAVTPVDIRVWGDEANLSTEYIGITGNQIIVAHYTHL